MARFPYPSYLTEQETLKFGLTLVANEAMTIILCATRLTELRLPCASVLRLLHHLDVSEVFDIVPVFSFEELLFKVILRNVPAPKPK